MEVVYEVKELVWGKVMGYPWWPAIVRCEPKKETFEVVFLHTFDIAFLHKDKLKKFSEHINKPAKFNKIYSNALALADQIHS